MNNETFEITEEELAEVLELAQQEPFESIGTELEKHMYQNRTLYLNEEVTPETVSHIIMLIHKYNHDDGDMPVDQRIPIILYINTPGGDVYFGMSLISAIENSITPVVGYVDGGICMSMGMPLLLSCHYRIVTRHSTLLYHEIRANSDVATLREIRNTAQHYEHIQNKIDEYIVENTKVPLELLHEKRERNLDWYLTIEEVEKYGFAHEIL